VLSALLVGAALAAPVTVEVTQLRSTAGTVRLLAWNRAEGFPGKWDNAVVQRSLPATQPLRLTLELPAGQWAISVLHDEDNDGKLGTNLIGMPKEGVGASVPGGMSRLGPPRFEDAAFTVGTEAKTVQVAVVYLL
jgi:uncharacterized protein (DUF2141 family)